jgi:NADPH:quinone reductase-like Zn-dependent oxidoreductase
MSVPSTAKVAYLTELGKPLEVKSSDVAKPGPGEVLVQNHAIALNPVDWKMQATGFFVQEYPTVLGWDAAGVVADVGESVTLFKKGDKV